MRQLSLLPAKRKKPRGSGRQRAEKRKGFVVHRVRAEHDFRHPVHVTMRRVRLGPDFRTQRVRNVLLHALAWARAKGVRVVQYSIQADHLHLMIEGADAADLSTQMRKLFSRIAMMVNHALKRRGALFRDRHHRHALETPREVRNALVYILFNARKHLDFRAPAAEAQALRDAPDPCSSAPWFAHWAAGCRPPDPARPPTDPPIAEATTWLATTGWKRAGGPIRFDEQPRQHL